jgi:hypothetical protein
MAASNGGPAPDVAALAARPSPGSHRTTIVIDGRRVDTLADLPPLRNRLLFVGLNPSPVSVEAGHYHQGRLGRTFWRRLIAAQILPKTTEVETADDALMAAGHGITDLLKLPSPRDTASGLRLQASSVDRRGTSTRGEVGPTCRRRARGAAVLPDAGPVRAARGSRRGSELHPEPRRVAA